MPKRYAKVFDDKGELSMPFIIEKYEAQQNQNVTH